MEYAKTITFQFNNPMWIQRKIEVIDRHFLDVALVNPDYSEKTFIYELFTECLLSLWMKGMHPSNFLAFIVHNLKVDRLFSIGLGLWQGPWSTNVPSKISQNRNENSIKN